MLVNRQHNQIRRIFFQKNETGIHRIFAQSENFGDLDTKLSNLAFGTAFRDESPALKRFSDAGEVLPFGAPTRLDMEHGKFGSGRQCDLQGVHEGDFAGRGKI
jgi:hypothetical protein